MIEAAELFGIDFGVNCILNNEMKIAAVFTGGLVECHSTAVKYVRDYLGVGIEKPDVIVTCPGQPLDIDFYQSAKALIGLTEILDGDIVTLLTCGCAEGVNSPDMLRAFGSGKRCRRSKSGRRSTTRSRWITFCCLQRSTARAQG